MRILDYLGIIGTTPHKESEHRKTWEDLRDKMVFGTHQWQPPVYATGDIWKHRPWRWGDTTVTGRFRAKETPAFWNIPNHPVLGSGFDLFRKMFDDDFLFGGAEVKESIPKMPITGCAEDLFHSQALIADHTILNKGLPILKYLGGLPRGATSTFSAGIPKEPKTDLHLQSWYAKLRECSEDQHFVFDIEAQPTILFDSFSPMVINPRRPKELEVVPDPGDYDSVHDSLNWWPVNSPLTLLSERAVNALMSAYVKERKKYKHKDAVNRIVKHKAARGHKKEVAQRLEYIGTLYEEQQKSQKKKA